MRIVTRLIVLTAVISAREPLWAKPGRFDGYRTVDATGRFYAVVKPVDPETAVGRFGVPVEIRLAERSSGSGEVKPAWGRGRDFDVREGDKVLGHLVLEGAPRDVVVSSTGLGFVAFDVGAWKLDGKDPKKHERVDDAMVIVANDGTVKFRIPISEVFSDKEMEQFPHVMCPSDILWYGASWIDEGHHELVLVGDGRSYCSRSRRISRPQKPPLRTVNLDTGKVSRASSEVVVRALEERNLAALELASELAGQMRLQEAVPGLRAVLDDERLGSAGRLRAAVALAELGDLRGADTIAEAALESADRYAISNLHLLSEDGASLARGVVARHGADVAVEAGWALSALKGRGVATLIEMLANDRDRQGQRVAFSVIAGIGPLASDAAPTLLEILERAADDAEELSMRRSAAAALGNIGLEAKGALPALRRFRNRAKSTADFQRAEARRNGDDSVKIDQADYLAAAQAIKKIETRAPKGKRASR
jgi:hypothetical protein